MPSISSSSRAAIAAGLAVVTVLAAASISPVAMIAPVLVIAALLLVPDRPAPRLGPTLSAQLRAVAFPSSSVSLLHAAIGAALGLVYVVVVLAL